MTVFLQALLFVIIYLCIYALVDRICKCVETCAIAKSYSKFIQAHDVKDDIARFGKEMKENGASRAQTGGEK